MSHPSDSAAATPPATMRAVVRTAYGSPESLRLAERPVPVPGDDEVLVNVRAAGVDAGTWHLVTGTPYLMRLLGYGLRAPKNPVVGLAFAGRVVAVGSAVTTVHVGDDVMGSAPGAFADYVTAAASKVRPTPRTLDYVHAAALPISAVTALEAVRGAQIRADDRVLVLGAGGGVGHFAVQLAVAAGGVVTAVCSGAKQGFAKELGATEVIDYTKTDVTELYSLWNVIIDIAGHRPLARLRKILTPTGTLVVVGGENGGAVLGGTERILGVSLANLLTKQRLRGLVSREDPADYEVLAAQVDAGEFAPRVQRTFPLSEAKVAVALLHGGGVRGKVVLEL